MKGYWRFLVVGVICLLVALLWARPPQGRGMSAPASSAASQTRAAASEASSTGSSSPARNPNKNSDDEPLPGSSSSLPLLAVIGFGVLAGGITSAMRTR